jgi:uncharacterized membrane protein
MKFTGNYRRVLDQEEHDERVETSNQTQAAPPRKMQEVLNNKSYNKSIENRVPIDETGIALKGDREKKFRRLNPSKAWLDTTNEHVMVWYQMESFPNFNKLWGHLYNVTLYAGVTYVVEIENRFDVSKFDGKKYLYISEVNRFGGKSRFMGIFFLVMAAILVLMMLVFVFLYFTRVHGKDIYSTEDLTW